MHELTGLSLRCELCLTQIFSCLCVTGLAMENMVKHLTVHPNRQQDLPEYKILLNSFSAKTKQ